MYLCQFIVIASHATSLKRSEAVFLTKARLHIDSVLNFKTMTRIMDSGHRSVASTLSRCAHTSTHMDCSRIPAYGQSRDEIVGVLFVKDLAFIDPDDNTPLNSVLKFYNHEMREVPQRDHSVADMG